MNTCAQLCLRSQWKWNIHSITKMLHKSKEWKQKQSIQQVVVNCLSWCVHYTVQQQPSRPPHLPMVTTVHSHCPVLCGLCWAVVMENIRSLHSASVNTWIIGSGFSLLLTFNVFIEMTSQLLSTGWKIIHLYKLQHNFTLHPSSSVNVMFYYYAFLYIRLYKKMSECLVMGLPLAAL